LKLFDIVLENEKDEVGLVKKEHSEYNGIRTYSTELQFVIQLFPARAQRPYTTILTSYVSAGVRRFS